MDFLGPTAHPNRITQRPAEMLPRGVSDSEEKKTPPRHPVGRMGSTCFLKSSHCANWLAAGRPDSPRQALNCLRR